MTTSKCLENRKPIQVGLELLQALRILATKGGESWGVTEFGRALGVTKNKAFRVLDTLEQGGLVAQEEVSHRYFLTNDAHRLGTSLASSGFTTVIHAKAVFQATHPPLGHSGEKDGLGIIQISILVPAERKRVLQEKLDALMESLAQDAALVWTGSED